MRSFTIEESVNNAREKDCIFSWDTYIPFFASYSTTTMFKKLLLVAVITLSLTMPLRSFAQLTPLDCWPWEYFDGMLCLSCVPWTANLAPWSWGSATWCLICEAWYFAANFWQETCDPCPAWRFNPNVQATECPLCPPGTQSWTWATLCRSYGWKKSSLGNTTLVYPRQWWGQSSSHSNSRSSKTPKESSQIPTSSSQIATTYMLTERDEKKVRTIAQFLVTRLSFAEVDTQELLNRLLTKIDEMIEFSEKNWDSRKTSLLILLQQTLASK